MDEKNPKNNDNDLDNIILAFKLELFKELSTIKERIAKLEVQVKNHNRLIYVVIGLLCSILLKLLFF